MNQTPSRKLGLRRVLEQPRHALRWLVELDHSRKFETWPGAFRGVYPSFQAALAAAPQGKVGYNHAELTNLYDYRLGKAFASDYPTLFWLDRLIGNHPSLFDWGGHTGVSYYTYQKYLTLPPSFRWCVCDVPEIAKAGTKLALEKGATGLDFTTKPPEMSNFDILMAAGSLQFMEAPLDETLSRLERKPPHLLINKLPLYDGDDFFTLQNTLHSFNPYKVQNRARFVRSIEALGYEVVDDWETPDMGLVKIPLFPEHSLSVYSGYYFRAKASSG
jgi:putative methyltransferase (TIGR04325 family)